jgi:hypothetical protein
VPFKGEEEKNEHNRMADGWGKGKGKLCKRAAPEFNIPQQQPRYRILVMTDD